MIRFLLIILFCLVPILSQANPTVVGTPTVVTQGSGTPTWIHSHLNPTGGDVILIGVNVANGNAIETIDYGGATPVLLGQNTTFPDQHLFFYTVDKSVQPAEGSSHDLTITWSANEFGFTVVYKISALAVSEMTTVADTYTAQSSFGTDSAAGNGALILDIGSGEDGADMTAGSNQTVVSNNNAFDTMLSSYKTVIDSSTMSWLGSTSTDWSHLIAIVPNSGKVITIQ